MAQTPLGTQADLDVVQNLYIEQWWLHEFLAMNLSAIWQRQWFPHNC
jgi:hypothetical protein